MAKKKIQYQDKTRFDISGDQITCKFTYADANQIKDVVNTNADLLHEHNNKLFLDKINQDLSDLASPTFKNLGVENNVNANVVSANTEVNTANVNATNKVNTKLLNADNAIVNFHINSDTLTAETQIDTNILNAILQVNTDTVNASNVVNTDILNADSQVNTVEVRTNIARVGEQSSNTFVSGFAGLGYRLAKDSNGNYMLELDRLTVRKDFTVYELIISQIRATNGSLWVSDATKIESVTKDGSNYRCTIDTDGDTIWIPFQVDDIVRCQRFNGKSLKYYTAKVVSINATDKHFTLQVIEGANFPQAKDDIVRIGNATNSNRQGAVYLTASDNGAPFIDVIDGVTNASLGGKTKVRLGKLDGIIDPSLGQLSGYGLYANSAYIKGKFIVENGSNVYTKGESNTAIDSAKNSAINKAKVYTDAQNQAFYNDAKTYADQEIAELRQSVVDLETEIEGAFADGIIQEAEAISIEKYLNVLGREKADIDNQFTIVYGNVNLTGTAKTNLNTAKTALNTSYTSLVSAINTAIADGKTTPTEKTAVDNAFTDFKTKNATYSTRVNEALEAIRNKGINDLNASMKSYSDAQDNAKETLIKAYADGKVDAEEARAIADAEAKLNQAKADATQKANDAITTSTNNAKAYTDAQINELGGVLEDLESTINSTFQDGIIEKAEAIAIEKYINEINVEKLQLDNQYSIVYANANLVGSAKTNLSTAKTAYNSSHTTLINSINNAIADGKTTVAEKNAVNTHFGNYRTALGTLSTRIQEAIESIRAKASTDLDTTLKAYALAQDNLKETIIKAYADGIVTEEEQRAIADAEAKLLQAKADATAKANQAKQDAINASAIDAQNKANQAQANAIASANQFSLDAVKAINIGGRNLLRDSRHKNFKLYGASSYGNILISDDYPTQLIRVNKTSSATTPVGFQNNTTDVFQIIQGQEYIISFDVRSENIPTLNYIYFMRNDGTNFSYGSINIPSGEEFSRVSKTITAPFTSNQTYLMFSYNGANTGWFEVKSIKIEKGNKATDWSPNPDEVEDNLEVFRSQTTTKFEVLDTAIQSKVSQNDYNALNQRVGTAESTITQHANQIQSKVSQTSFDTLNNTVGGLSGRVSSAESSITQQAGLIATKVSQSEVDVTVGNAVNNLQVGGRNILKKSRTSIPSSNNGSTVPISTLRITEGDREFIRTKRINTTSYPDRLSVYNAFPSDRFTINPKGKKIMMSFSARASHPVTFSSYVDTYNPNGSLIDPKPNIYLTTEWKTFEYYVESFPDLDAIGGIRFHPLLTTNLTGIIDDFYLDVCEFKIEEGNKATAWTPAPEDGEIELNDLKTRVSTSETSITQNADQIALRATKTEVTTAQNSAIATSKSYTDNSISVTNNAIALKADKTVTDSLNSRMNSAELKITDSAIISTVKASTETIATQKANEAVSNISLANRNILLKSGLVFNKEEGDGKYNIGFYNIASPFNPLAPNKVFTLVVKGSNSGAGSLGAWVNGSQPIKTNLISNETDVIKFITFTRNSATNIGTNISFYHYPNGSAGTSRIEWACLYEGAISNPLLDWTPAPEDGQLEIDGLVSRISTAETSITQNSTDINLRATKTELTSAKTDAINTASSDATTKANNAIASSKTYTDNQITVTNNAIALKADKTVTDSLNSRMNNAELKITPSAIISTVKTSTEQIAKDAVDSMQLGGVNILNNSNSGSYFNSYQDSVLTKTDNVSVAEWGATDAHTVKSSGGTNLLKAYAPLYVPKNGEIVTISFWVRNNHTNKLRLNSNQGAMVIDIEPNEQRRVIWNGIEGNGTGSIQIQPRPYNGIDDIVDFTWWRIQVEAGTKATDWRPSLGDVDSQFTQVNTKITNAESSITQQAGLIATKVSQTEVNNSVNNAIDNIKIGGRNYGVNTSAEYANISMSSYSATVPNGYIRFDKMNLKVGDSVTFRTYLKNATGTRPNIRVRLDVYDDGNNYTQIGIGNYLSTEGYSECTVLMTEALMSTYTRFGLRFTRSDASSTATAYTIQYKEVKLEVGTKATDWSLNPDDVINDISNITTRVTNTETSITQTNASIALKADKTVTDGLNTRLNTAESKITPTAIISTVKDSTEAIANTAVNNLKIGGNNIFKDSLLEKVTQYGSASNGNITITSRTNQSNIIRVNKTSSANTALGWQNRDSDTFSIVQGKEYTLSFDIRSSGINELNYIYIMRNDGSNSSIGSISIPSGTSFNRVNKTFTAPFTSNQGFFMISYNGTAIGWFEITDVKIEEGNKGTGWSLNPLDLESRITSAESSITQQAGLINLRVTQTELNTVVKDIVDIKDTRDTNEIPAWYFTNHKMKNVREFKRRDVIGLGNVSSSSVYCELTTYVPWTDSSGGPVVQEATVERITYSRFGTTTAWSSWLEGESTAGSQAKANTAQTQAIAGAKTYTDNQINITNTAITLKADKTVTDGLTSRMSNAEAKITADAINLTVKAQTQQIANQASAQTFANGKMLYTDPAFVVGENGMVQYPNNIGTTMTRVNNQTDSPTKNNIAYKFLHTAMADSNRCSLVRWANQSRSNAVFVTRIVAKLPVGWRIQDAHNSYGDSANRSVTWLTPTLGTGMYEEYVLKLVCGNTGTFSTINHFDLRKVDASTPTPTSANPIESYIAWATVYDMSEVYNKPSEEEIKAGISITSNAINIFGQTLSLSGKVTFTSLDASTQNTVNTASSNASSALSTANTANSNANTAKSDASSALSTANTANSNANTAKADATSAKTTANTASTNATTALNTANTANSNATNAKNKTDAWSFATTTEIDGAKIRTGTITADKINTDNLIARQIKTSEDDSRASLNEGNDGQFKVRHPNGQVAIQMGLVGGVPKIVFYDSSGNKVWEGGTAGIVYVNDVPESWTMSNLYFMDSITTATETLTSTKYNSFKSKIKLNSSGTVTNRKMNAGTNYYLYSEGINATSGTNKQYAGYHTNQVKSVSNFIPNGWYIFGNSTLFSDGPGTGTYSGTVFKVFNGIVQDDYDVISGIS
ncbi:hypothetical protein CHU00_18415 [Sphingobacterium cellulitidis]|nr:hypothetical protein CHU00_18415 [Sphingobacterium cellulitidis]